MDQVAFFNWYSLWLILGLLGLPLTSQLFSRLPDLGYAHSKIISLIAISYLAWVMGHLPNQNLTSAVYGLVVWLIINLAILLKQRHKLVSNWRARWPLLLLIELLFLVCLSIWSSIRAINPDINGLEKFMDYGFMYSSLRTPTLPPYDMWFLPFSINYYYFGHYFSAVASKLSSVAPAFAYNLQIATLFALAVSQSFSLGYSLIVKALPEWGSCAKSGKLFYYLSGMLMAFLYAIRGNLHQAAYRLHQLIQPQTDRNPVLGWLSQQLPELKDNYWYPDATRYIPYTIHEFPMYSFVVADLHAHVLSIPLILVMIAVIIQLLSQENLKLINFIFPGWLMGLMIMTNMWDFPIYLILLLLSLIVWLKFRYKLAASLPGLMIALGTSLMLSLWWFVKLSASSNSASLTESVAQTANNISALNILTTPFTWVLISGLVLVVSYIVHPNQQTGYLAKLWRASKRLITISLVLISLAVLTSWLFWKNFQPLGQGIQPVFAHSPLNQLLTLWGWDLFGLAVLLLLLLKQTNRFTQDNLSRWDYFALMLYAWGFVLVVFPEFLYLKDIYIKEYHRANTMFKLVYQSWAMFALANSYTWIKLLNLKPRQMKYRLTRYGLLLTALYLIWQMSAYPLAAVQSMYPLSRLETTQSEPSLDGELWLKKRYPDDWQAIVWLKQKPQTFILEANGDSYTEVNRFSTFSADPTVLGWYVHEWLWRNGTEPLNQRVEDIRTIYTSDDLPLTKKLLKQYNIHYIIVSQQEKEKFPQLNLAKLSQLSRIAFQSGETLILEVDLNLPDSQPQAAPTPDQP